MEWTHSICDLCWSKRCKQRNEGGQEPSRLKLPYWQVCCFCGSSHNSGIYVREHQDNCPHCPDKELSQ